MASSEYTTSANDDGVELSDDELDAELFGCMTSSPAKEEHPGGEAPTPPPAQPPVAGKRKKDRSEGAAGRAAKAARRAGGSKGKRRSSGAKGASAARPDALATSDLGLLPPELIMRVLGFLSPASLATLSSTCSRLAEWGQDDGLWRRLYCRRWPPGGGASAHGGQPVARRGDPYDGPFRRRYFTRDADELREVVSGAPPVLRDVFMQMHAAHREVEPPLSAGSAGAEDDYLMLVDPSVAERVEQWRAQHGPFPDPAGHHCSGRSCKYHTIGGDVYICIKAGCVHVCDDTCRERVVDANTDTLVCTVSGRCFERLVSMEEHDEGAHADDDPDQWVPGQGGGRLGSAYMMGYLAESEEQLANAWCGFDRGPRGRPCI